MNFLAICQRAARECGVTVDTSTPAAVTNQTGQLRKVVDWAAEAWDDIQLKHPNWKWLRSRFTVNTVAGDDTYAGTDCTDSRLSATVTRFSKFWVFDEEGDYGITIYKQSDGVGTERELPFKSWAEFRRQYKRGTQSNGTPACCTLDPQGNLVLGPAPDAVYVVQGEYQMGKQTLAADADTPEMPSDYHLLVVYKTMEKYGQFEVAPEIFNRGVRDGGKMMTNLEEHQLPEIALAEPLA